jgi:threonine dehydrogenase-like Zn-dependent dehydrogenase
MKQLTRVGTRRLEWRDVREPRLQGPDEALVRPIAVARCDMDYLLIRYPLPSGLGLAAAAGVVDRGVEEAFGCPPVGGPIAIGHECVAEVIDEACAKTVWPGRRCRCWGACLLAVLKRQTRIDRPPAPALSANRTKWLNYRPAPGQRA